ncbi:YwaF family protein [Mycoplasma sp. Pen4]|uniref:TMEM164 family acyltransferase n=1 Tax=Mycoplasma sp. Pen4 TaxID=640330 RepID=UPI001654373B|nr:YwaF family protein [Mycoplasma sp. Pen4]QNM93896.1 YwaF family protein [Mycoplasma sp. Pen4]
MKFGFFRWIGTNEKAIYDNKDLVPSTTNIIFIVTLSLVLLTSLLLWIFKRQIHQIFVKRNLSLKTQAIITRSIGAFMVTLMIIRIVMLGITDYPRPWELIPLHFCRLIALFVGVILLMNKPQWLKYFVAMAFLGAIIAFGTPDTKIAFVPKENITLSDQTLQAGKTYYAWISYNNFSFWDFIIIHSLIILIPVIFGILYPYNITFKDSLITIAIFSGLLIFTFIINWTTDSIATDGDFTWKTNFFYTARDTNVNAFVIKPWPIVLLISIIFGALYVFLASGIFYVQDKLVFGKWFVRKQESSKVFRDDLYERLVVKFKKQK